MPPKAPVAMGDGDEADGLPETPSVVSKTTIRTQKSENGRLMPRRLHFRSARLEATTRAAQAISAAPSTCATAGLREANRRCEMQDE